jgi:tetratricopeptide (TPR) repeat protein
VDGNKTDDLFTMSDELAARVSQKLGIAVEDSLQDLSIAQATTSSLEAYRYYQKGLEYLWEWNFTEAINDFEYAIEIDPTFALAYLFLAISEARYGMTIINPLTDISGIKENLALAKKHSDRVTERERLLIELNTANLDMNSDLSYEKAHEFVTKYPKDKFAYQSLANIAWKNGDPEKCLQATEKVLELDPTDANAYNTKAYCLSFLNRYDEAISTVKKPIPLQPDNGNTYDSAWEIHMHAGKFDEAIRFAEEGLKKAPNARAWNNHVGYALLLKGDVEAGRDRFRRHMENYPGEAGSQLQTIGISFLLEGKYEEAISWNNKALELAQENRSIQGEIFSHMGLGKILIAQTKYDEAVKEFQQAERFSRETYDEKFNPIPVFTQYWTGITLAKKGDFEGAEKQADQLRGLIDKGNYERIHLDFYYLLNGKINVAQQNGHAAQEAIDKLTPWTQEASPESQEIKANSLALKGDSEEAIEAYKDFYVNVGLYRYGMGDRYVFFYERSMADYNIAKIYEKMGDTAKAVEHYEKFLDLMKAADPGIDEVEDAKTRLANLK